MINKIKCLLGFHFWDERCERLTCLRCNKNMYFDDERIKKVKYRKQSHRNLSL